MKNMFPSRFIYFIMVINIISTNGEELGYCDIGDKECGLPESASETLNEKYIFYDVNPPEGFNLRRDVYMRFAIMLAESRKSEKRKNWRLVLPPWFRLYHWRTQTSKPKPIPWKTFFDIDSLKSYAPVAELNEVFTKIPTKNKKLQIDVLYHLQNFEDPFEGGTFIDKWEISKEDCEYDGNFWGYKNITASEVICVKYQGKISKLWELIALHREARTVMFSHGEIPLHETYGTKAYWDCRKSMRFNKDLVEISKTFIKNHLNCNEELCSTYIGVHWRRQDFAHSRANDVPSLPGTIIQIDRFIKTNCQEVSKIFIATDASTMEINMLEKELAKIGYQVYFYLPTKSILNKYADGGVAIIEQIICSHGKYFLGTHESTFTFRIQEEREVLGFDSKTTFNRLCPDKGKCEKMSKWTIVQ